MNVNQWTYEMSDYGVPSGNSDSNGRGETAKLSASVKEIENNDLIDDRHDDGHDDRYKHGHNMSGHGHNKKGVTMNNVKAVLIGGALGFGLLAAMFGFAGPDVSVVEEDSSSWSCVEMGNRACGPNNSNNAVPGCYNDIGIMVQAWPCKQEGK